MNLKLQTAVDQFLVQQDVTEIKTQKNGLENKTENKTQPYDKMLNRWPIILFSYLVFQ
jgi:FtsZ-binding cell division protein ZapB